jgi:hypothetical protein
MMKLVLDTLAMVVLLLVLIAFHSAALIAGITVWKVWTVWSIGVTAIVYLYIRAQVK